MVVVNKGVNECKIECEQQFQILSSSKTNYNYLKSYSVNVERCSFTRDRLYNGRFKKVFLSQRFFPAPPAALQTSGNSRTQMTTLGKY